MYEEGHLIGNHTYHHVNYQSEQRDCLSEIVMGNEVIKNITGQDVEYMRPPLACGKRNRTEGTCTAGYVDN